MKKFRFTYFYLPFLLLLSCSDNSDFPESGGNEPTISDDVGVYVSFATRADGWNIDNEYSESLAALGDIEGPNEEKPYIIDSFSEGDILYVSQMGTIENPTLYNMQGYEYATPSYDKETVKPNLYIYTYKKGENEAQWNEGSNFVPYINEKNDSTPLNWSKIKNLGSVGNAYHFYAMFQPKYPYREANYGDIAYSQTPNFRTVTYMNYSAGASDNADHSAYELGTRYGLFGAYHATSSLYTRMRFRMYPMFNLMHVTLLVPVKEDEPDEPGYSGFDSNAFFNNWEAGNNSTQYYPGVWFGLSTSAFQKNLVPAQKGIGTSFDINWRASRSSDNDPPLILANTGNSPVSFYLLRYNINDPATEHPVFKLENVKEFYPAYTNKKHPDKDYDMVRRYEFIAYYVPQSTFSNSDFNALISMMLLTPGSSGKLFKNQNVTTPQAWSVEGTYVPYYYYGNRKNQSQQIGGDSDLGLSTQGTYTHLTLYVPRKGNETVMVSAKVMPWKETYTDMTIVEREEESE